MVPIQEEERLTALIMESKKIGAYSKNYDEINKKIDQNDNQTGKETDLGPFGCICALFTGYFIISHRKECAYFCCVNDTHNAEWKTAE